MISSKVKIIIIINDYLFAYAIRFLMGIYAYGIQDFTMLPDLKRRRMLAIRSITPQVLINIFIYD